MSLSKNPFLIAIVPQSLRNAWVRLYPVELVQSVARDNNLFQADR